MNGAGQHGTNYTQPKNRGAVGVLQEQPTCWRAHPRTPGPLLQPEYIALRLGFARGGKLQEQTTGIYEHGHKRKKKGIMWWSYRGSGVKHNIRAVQ